jgi:NADH:ubiquinone oxidoreductase subunit C
MFTNLIKVKISQKHYTTFTVKNGFRPIIPYAVMQYKKDLINIFKQKFNYKFIQFTWYDLRLMYNVTMHLTLLKYLAFNFNSQFVQLVEFSAVDCFLQYMKFRYILNIFLLSHIYNVRLHLITPVANGAIFIPSLTIIYESAKWLERELWDMYGLFFIGNSDLRRILTNYGFEGFPLKKDFPISGYKQIVYSEIEHSLSEDLIEMTQEMKVSKIK